MNMICEGNDSYRVNFSSGTGAIMTRDGYGDWRYRTWIRKEDGTTVTITEGKEFGGMMPNQVAKKAGKELSAKLIEHAVDTRGLSERARKMLFSTM